MDPLIIASLIGGGMSLFSGLVGTGASQSVAQKDISLQNAYLDEQKRLNQFQMDEYLDKKDYDRALQERIFQREDTAMQRGLQDYVDAGFSPLSALGQSANAGSVVSTSSAPSLNAPQAPDLSGMYQAIEHMVNGGTQAGAMVSTFLSQMADQQHQVNMEDLRFANALDTLTKGHENQKEILRLEADLREGSAETQHIRELEKISKTQEFQKTIEEFKANEARYLQKKQNKWQEQQSKDDRQHQVDMQNDAQQHQLDLLTEQDKLREQYENKTLAHAWSDLTQEGKDLFVKLLDKFDPEVAKYIQENEYGGDLLMRVVAMYESALPVLNETKDLINPLHGIFGK